MKAVEKMEIHIREGGSGTVSVPCQFRVSSTTSFLNVYLHLYVSLHLSIIPRSSLLSQFCHYQTTSSHTHTRKKYNEGAISLYLLEGGSSSHLYCLSLCRVHTRIHSIFLSHTTQVYKICISTLLRFPPPSGHAFLNRFFSPFLASSQFFT
jgi:hypothetical protein